MILRLRNVSCFNLANRKTVADTQIGDYMIPKDKTVVLSAWTIGNNPDLVDNPEEVRCIPSETKIMRSN